MESKAQILNRLAECRREYRNVENPEQLELLLENTMLAVQDLLALEKVEYI